MGFVGESQMHADPAVFNAVTKLKAGQITDILPLLDPADEEACGLCDL